MLMRGKMRAQSCPVNAQRARIGGWRYFTGSTVFGFAARRPRSTVFNFDMGTPENSTLSATPEARSAKERRHSCR